MKLRLPKHRLTTLAITGAVVMAGVSGALALNSTPKEHKSLSVAPTSTLNQNSSPATQVEAKTSDTETDPTTPQSTDTSEAPSSPGGTTTKSQASSDTEEQSAPAAPELTDTYKCQTSIITTVHHDDGSTSSSANTTVWTKKTYSDGTSNVTSVKGWDSDLADCPSSQGL